MKVAIIGFGEAGKMFAEHLQSHADVHVYDIKQDASKKTPLELRPSQAIVAMSDHLEANLKIMIDGLLGQSS